MALWRVRSTPPRLSRVVVCSRCGEDNTERARFCQACGSELHVPTANREERKLVSALFIDLVGSTAWAERSDPEDVREGLRLYHDRAKAEIDAFGGSVEKFIGDAVVAIFGAPVARGDDAERAVRAGLRVLEAIGELNREHPELELEARVAVNTGEAIVAVDARPELGEAFATGDVINTAARLQHAGPVGGLIVGAETYRATRRAIMYEPLPAVNAKGKRDPIDVWRAVEPLGQPVDGPATGAAAMVGRDRELDLLSSIWARALDERRPHLVSVLGPPGIGKSRLAAEFVSRVEAAGGRCIRGRCLPYEEQTGYRASAEQIRAVAGILESDSPAAARRKLASAVEGMLPEEEVADLTRYLSLLLGLGVDEPTGDRTQLFFALRRLMEGLASEQPTVAVFEDLHWADASQLDLLEHLAARVRDVPVVFLALARPEFADTRSSWGGGMLPHTTIPLEPLAATDAATIAASVLGPSGSPTIDRLVKISGGNPLFVEELAASLIDGMSEEGHLPATVRGAIASRIDLLPPDQRDVLLAASVIGATFWRGVLSAIEPGDGAEAALDALEAKDLIRREPHSQVEGDSEYTFKHVLIREVAYGTLPRATKRERHAGVARHVERSTPGNRRELAWLLAHHWREAGERDRAIEYLLLAAERALEGRAANEAVDLFRDALALLGDADADSSLRATIRLQRAIALVDLAQFEEGAAELDDLIPQLLDRQRLEALIARVRTTFWLEQMQEATEAGAEVRALAERLDDPELRGPALAAQSEARFMSGDIGESLAFGSRAFELWIPNTRPAEFAILKEILAEDEYWVGNYAASEELARGAYEMGGEMHHVEPLVRGGGWRGLTLAAMGRTEEALALLDTVVERSRELEVPRWGASSLNYSTLPFRDLFMLDEARRRNQEAIEIVRSHGEWGMPHLQGEIDLLLTDLMGGDIGRAQREWPRVWDAAINGATWRPWLGGSRLALVRTQIARVADRPETTIEHALDAIERAARIPRPKYEAAARALMGEALVELGRGDEGVAELRKAVAVTDRLGSPTPRWHTWSGLGRACYATGDDEGAAAAFAQARTVIETWTSTLTPEHAASVLAAEPVTEVLRQTG